MRDDLSEIFQDATHDVEYVFGDSIASIAQDARGVDVTFERGAPRRFDLVIGADGLHSNVRRLVFGDERGFAHFIGAYLAVLTLPNHLNLRPQMASRNPVGWPRYIAHATWTTRGPCSCSAAPRREYHHRDVARQKELLREAYRARAGKCRACSPRSTRAAFTSTRSPSFGWTPGRAARLARRRRGLLAGARRGRRHEPRSRRRVRARRRASGRGRRPGESVRACERALEDYVRYSRGLGRRMAKSLVPDSRFQLWVTLRGSWLIARLPRGLIRALAGLRRRGARMHDTIESKDYSGDKGTGREQASSPASPRSPTRHPWQVDLATAGPVTGRSVTPTASALPSCRPRRTEGARGRDLVEAVLGRAGKVVLVDGDVAHRELP